MYLFSSFNSFVRKKRQEYIREKRIKHLVNRVEDRLMKLSSNNGKGLTHSEINKIKVFYRNYGVKLSSYSFHNFYKQVTNKFDVRFLPEDVYYYEIDQYFNNWQMARFIDNKTFYPVLFDNVRQPEMICFRQNGYWYDKNGILISFDSVRTLLLKQKEVFIKVAQNSYGGYGVKYLIGKDALGHIGTINSDLVIQKPLEQSVILSHINPSSVNTIRVLSFLRKDGSVKVCSMVLRMGIGESKVDNASSGGITVGVQSDGKLNNIAYSVRGESYTLHPTTRIKFAGIAIPNISLVKHLVTTQATKFPYFRLISWDIALDKNDEPVLIEANLCDGELDFHQLNNGPLFGEETEAILSEVFSSK